MPFLLTYHSLLKQVNYIVRKHIHLLYMNEEVKKVFQPRPMVSFRSPRNLRSYLVRAKIYPMERKTRSCKCKGNRYVSVYLKRKYLPAQWPIRHTKLSIVLTVTTNAWYIFWHVRLVLSSMLVVPLIVPDIVRTIMNTMTEKMREVKLVFKNIFKNNFNSDGHNGFLHDLSVTLINKSDAKNPIKQEHYWWHILKTLATHGLNVEDDF